MSEAEKRTPKDKSITTQQIIESGGFYDIDNNWNSIITFDDHPGMLFRARVEVFIFDKFDDVFITPIHNGYRIPGGSIEKDRSYKYQVETEAREEARINLGTITYTGYSYFKYFKNKYTNCPIHWDGTYNMVYTADFKSWYHGPIKKSVRDYHMCNCGRFLPFAHVVKMLNYHHLRALNLI